SDEPIELSGDKARPIEELIPGRFDLLGGRKERRKRLEVDRRECNEPLWNECILDALRFGSDDNQPAEQVSKLVERKIDADIPDLDAVRASEGRDSEPVRGTVFGEERKCGH